MNYQTFALAAIVGIGLALFPVQAWSQSKEDGMRLFDDAKKLREQAQSNDDLGKAVDKYRAALKIFEKVRFLKGIGFVCINLGNVFIDWGQYDKAVEYYEKSLAIFRELKDKKGEANSLLGLGNVFKEWGQYDKAVQYYEKSLAMSRELKDKNGEGTTLNNLGIVFKNWGQYDKALESYEKSLAIARELKDRQTEGYNLIRLGNVFSDWGQYAKALESYEKSLAVFRELKDKKGEGASLLGLGGQHHYLGQFAKAKEYYEQSLIIVRDLRDKKEEGGVLNNLGLVFKDWGKYDEALEYYEKSVAISREAKNRTAEGNTLGNLGMAYSDWGQYQKAIDFYEKSLAIWKEHKNKQREGFTLMNIGCVYARRGEHAKALKSFEEGLWIWKEIKVPTGRAMFNIGMLYLDMGEVEKAKRPLIESNYWSGLGRLYLMKSDYEKAKEFYEKLLTRAEKNRHADNLFTAYAGLACAYEGLGHDGIAEEYFGKAVNFAEELRSSLSKAERETFFDARINGFYRTAPYEGLARVLTKMQKPVEAFKASEYTKARVFAEGLTRFSEGSALGVPAEVIKNDEQITDQLAGLKKNLQKAYEKNNQLIIKSLNPQIDKLEEQRGAHIKMLRGKYPLFAAVKYPEPMDLAQTALKDNEWVLSYDVTDPGLIVYLTKGKELVKGLFKPIPRKELDELVRKFREPLELGDEDLTAKKLASFDFASGKKLADILLADTLSDLPKGTPVIIVPDDSLGVLPFEMLVLNEAGQVKNDAERAYVTGAEFFSDRNPISYYQSVTALTLARTFGKEKKIAAKRLVMCDPIFGGDDDDRLSKMAKEKQKALVKSLPDKLLSIKKELGITFPRLELTGVLGRNLKKVDPSVTDEHDGMDAAKPMLFHASAENSEPTIAVPSAISSARVESVLPLTSGVQKSAV